jgi:hypothetical protein
MSDPYRAGANAPIDLWDEWLGPRWRARSRLDETEAFFEKHYTAEGGADLLALARTQGKEIARLQAIVLSLVRALGRTGALDADALQADVYAQHEAAGVVLDRVRALLRGPVDFDPERRVPCDRCKNSVVARTTFVTGAGTLCDRCYHATVGGG